MLQWVHESAWAQPGKLQHLEPGQRSEVLPQFTDAELDDALRRLSDHGLIEGQRTEALVVWWTNVRPTADGLRVLAEWPPLEAATINVTLARVLRALAGSLDEEEATAAKRAGAAVSKMSGDVVLDVVQERLKKLGEDIVA